MAEAGLGVSRRSRTTCVPVGSGVLVLARDSVALPLCIKVAPFTEWPVTTPLIGGKPAPLNPVTLGGAKSPLAGRAVPGGWINAKRAVVVDPGFTGM